MLHIVLLSYVFGTTKVVSSVMVLICCCKVVGLIALSRDGHASWQLIYVQLIYNIICICLAHDQYIALYWVI